MNLINKSGTTISQEKDKVFDYSMHLFRFICIAILIIFKPMYSWSQNSDQAKADHVIIIVLDGFGSEALQHTHTPNINNLIEEGFLALKCRSVIPSVSAPNYVSMLTGAGPMQHGVLSNDWSRNTQHPKPVTQGVENIFPTLFSWLRQQEPESKIHFFHTWKGIKPLFEISTIDKVVHNNGEELIQQARQTFITEKPRLMFINIGETDKMGHTYGWESPEFFETATKYDRLIGNFVQELKEQNLFDKTTLVISADHGGEEKSHGGFNPVVMNMPVVMAGGGITKGSRQLDPCYVYDVAPTVAEMLGIEPDNAIVGRVLSSAFKNDPTSDPIYVPKPLILPRSGFYNRKNVKVTIQVDRPEAKIYYTLDGSTPDMGSKLYKKPFHVRNNTIIKAISVLNGTKSSMFTSQIRLNTGIDKRVQWAYFEGNWIEVPNFSDLSALKTGNSYEISLENLTHRSDHFGIRYKSKIELPKDGEYTFYTNSDDGSVLYINDKKVVDNNGSHAITEKGGHINLKAGIHDLEVHYFEDFMGEFISVSIASEDIPKQIITNKLFR